MKGILLHGGHGTRLRPLTHTGPKQLLPIANKPMSEYCIDSLREAGITEIAIIIGGLGSNKVQEYYGTGKEFGVSITYVKQDQPKGISHAIRMCKEFVGNDKFVVFLGDNIIQKSIFDFVKDFNNSDADASVLLCEVDNPSRFGIAIVENKQIKKIIEKPKNPTSNLAVTGIYLLTPKIFDVIERLKPSWRNELEITDALQMLLEENDRITFHMITDYWKDTGTPDDIIHANSFILNGMKSFFCGEKENDVLINGKVMVGEGTKIKSDVIIEGPVIIGKNCIIEKGARIGPNVSIGNNSRISGCHIENSIIMENCLIESNINIENSIIAFNSEIKRIKGIKNNRFLLGEGTKIFLQD